MSIASLGVVSGLAGTALPQRAAETEKAQRESIDQARATEASQRAADASGIGQTEEDAQSSERDADGRRLWEQPAESKRASAEPAKDDASATLAKDPSGACGGLLDLVG